MNVLVTSAGSNLGGIVANALAHHHDVKRTDRAAKASGSSIVASDLGHESDTDELVRGMDAVVHIAYGGHPDEPSALIDFQTRCVYNLLMACVNTGVPRAFCLSTLKVMGDYEPILTVTERWKPLPPTDDEILASHLAEYVFREFAREQPISTASLRLGFPLITGSRNDAEASGDTAALATEDVGLALDAALNARLPKWQVLHIQSPVSDQRFLMSTAESLIAYPAAKGGAR